MYTPTRNPILSQCQNVNRQMYKIIIMSAWEHTFTDSLEQGNPVCLVHFSVHWRSPESWVLRVNPDSKDVLDHWGLFDIHHSRISVTRAPNVEGYCFAKYEVFDDAWKVLLLICRGGTETKSCGEILQQNSWKFRRILSRNFLRKLDQSSPEDNNADDVEGFFWDWIFMEFQGSQIFRNCRDFPGVSLVGAIFSGIFWGISWEWPEKFVTLPEKWLEKLNVGEIRGWRISRWENSKSEGGETRRQRNSRPQNS